ncbi:MAG: segregation and condensation protein A [Sphingomonadales bacterium]|jgi:segregation and condensation protein A
MSASLDLDFDDAAAESAPSENVDRLKIDIDGWEGPLDLLLTLARNQKVDLRQISILQLVEQYLHFIESARALKLELAADYLVMAAWLAYLKSALLLPKDPTIDPSPEELALRLQLRLERLNAMRESGARLMARDRIGRDVFLRGTPEGLRVVRTTAWDCSYFELIATYGQIQARSAPVMHVVKRRAVMTLDEALDHVSKMLGVALEWTSLEAFLPKDADPQLRRSALASSFLAMLELAKQGRLELQQETSFAPLMVKVSLGTISERAHQ